MSSIPGLPPLPRCFSGLAGSDSSQWKETERLHTLKSNLLEGLAKESVTEQTAMNGPDKLNRPRTNADVKQSDGAMTSFNRLNSSLTKLRREMVDLRQLDVSLLCQLWSLHEAIQDYKTVMMDRYSETASEYSCGLSSRVSSFTSLTEEDEDEDWSEDYHLANEHEPNGDLHRSSIHSSTSSLLQQINQLKERVETDF